MPPHRKSPSQMLRQVASASLCANLIASSTSLSLQFCSPPRLLALMEAMPPLPPRLLLSPPLLGWKKPCIIANQVGILRQPGSTRSAASWSRSSPPGLQAPVTDVSLSRNLWKTLQRRASPARLRRTVTPKGKHSV